MENKRHKDILIEVLQNLGGEAHLNKIYEEFKKLARKYNVQISKSYKATIRGTLERYSSDSNNFVGKEDIFYLKEKGTGIWGLRDIKEKTINSDLKGSYNQKKIALAGSIGKDDLKSLLSDIETKLKNKDKVSLWWSYPIKHCKEDYEKEKPFWFYFYQDGKLKARCKVVDFITHEGDDGIECPENWEDFILDEGWKGKKKLSERKNEIFKTWLLIDKIEELNEYIPLKDLKSFCNRKINPIALKNGFLYVYDPIINSKKFLENLKLENHQIASFYNALKTKGFVILAGLSGTGKTKIFEDFVKYFPNSKSIKKEKWIVTEDTEEKLVPIKKEQIQFGNGRLKIQDFIESINEKLMSTTNRKVFLKINKYYTELIPVVEELKNRTDLINASEITNHLAVYIGSLFGFEIIEKEDIKKLGLKKLDKKLKIKKFEQNLDNNLFFPVRPDFKDSKSLLGFYNPLKREYHTTPLLDFVLEASKNYLENGKDSDPFFVLFDEMNLARVEYYFADFLSVLEAKKFQNLSEAIGSCSFIEFIKNLGKELNEGNYKFTSQSIKLHNEESSNVPKELFLPPNLYFIGTVNIDETTHMFSPKVLDRAFTIEFDVGCFDEYLNFLKNSSNGIENKGNFASINKGKILEFLEKNKKYKDKLEEINQILKPFNLHFGYRVFDEIVMFLYNCQNSLIKFENLDEAFDLALKMKVLPKFHGTRQKLKKPILRFLNFCEIKSPEELIKEGIPDLNSIDSDYKHTAHKLLEMLYKLQTQGFTSFM